MTDEETHHSFQSCRFNTKTKFSRNRRRDTFSTNWVFDKYVKENIDYGFDALNYSIKYPLDANPYDSAFRSEGFLK